MPILSSSGRRALLLAAFALIAASAIQCGAADPGAVKEGNSHDASEEGEVDNVKTPEALSPSSETLQYGVDVSWPMFSTEPSTLGGATLGSDVSRRYRKHLEGCYAYYNSRQRRNHENSSAVLAESADHSQSESIRTKEQECDNSERDRIQMNQRQPMSARNYTALGFKKIKAPTQVFQLLQEFWRNNRQETVVERWHAGQIYVNHWDAPSLMVPLENTTLVGGGEALRQHLWNAARDTIEQWTGQRQVECSLYGIRVYQDGAVLAPHVDRPPLVASAIINVDQDLTEPWPLEVIGHDGMAHNVTMEPGDMVLYESHSIIHGRPFPLKGKFMANVFMHFEPIGPLRGELEFDGKFPPYIVDGTPDAEHWRRNHPDGHVLMQNRQVRIVDGIELKANEMAGARDGQQYDELVSYLNANPASVSLRDRNGWTALAEAIRTGHVPTVQLLLERGASPNARLGPNGEAGSLLWMAVGELGSFHPVVTLLRQWNARIIEPNPGVVVEGLKSARDANDTLGDKEEDDDDDLQLVEGDGVEDGELEEQDGLYFEGYGDEDEYDDEDEEEEAGDAPLEDTASAASQSGEGADLLTGESSRSRFDAHLSEEL